jgi:TPR repeat protein
MGLPAAISRDVRGGLKLLREGALGGDVHASYWMGVTWLRMDELSVAEGVGGAQAAAEEAPAQCKGSRPVGSEEVEAARFAAAQAVMAEIKALRSRAASGRRALSSSSPPTGGVLDEAAWLAEDTSAAPLVRSTARGYAWLLRAAAADHGDAQVALGNLCMRGVAPLGAPPGDAAALSAAEARAAPRIAEAMGWYELAARGGGDGAAAPSSEPHPDALFNLGSIYWGGVEGHVAADERRAIGFFEAAAALGDASALCFLGQVALEGSEAAGVPRNSRMAVRHLERAACAGHAGASHTLASLWRAGAPGFPADAARARYFLQSAAEQGARPSVRARDIGRSGVCWVSASSAGHAVALSPSIA